MATLSLVAGGLTLFLPATALGAAPTAATGPTSSVGQTSATVTGAVGPGGEATSWYVEYGTTTAYGSKTSSRSAGNGTSAVDVSTQLTGLQTGATYHYRLVATNDDGLARGADASFTLRGAPEATTGSASLIGPFRAQLSGTVDPNGLPTTWYAEYGTSTAYGARSATGAIGAGASPVNVAVDLGGLQSGVVYHFRIVATNDAGTSRGSDRSFRTDRGPSVATGSADSVGPTSARVSGSVNPNGRGTTAWFEYGTSTKYGARTSEQNVGFGTRSTTVRETLAGLVPGATVHYRAVARSDAGTTFGSDGSFQTSTRPVVVTGVATAIQATSASVNGSVTPNGRSTSWWFEYGTTAGYGSRTPSAPAGSGTAAVPVTAPIGNLPIATDIHVRVVAENSGGRTYGNDVVFRTSGPPSATTGQVTGLGITKATVSGRVNPIGIATTWWFEYGRTPSLGLRTAGVSAGSANAESGVSAALTGLTPGVRWYYRVVAESAGGRSAGAVASFGTPPVPRDASGRRARCTIVGTVGPDVLRGTSRRDVICGLGGDDRIAGLGGNDLILAGAGYDVVSGGSGADSIEGGSGRDTISGDAGADTLRGGAGNDRVLGGGGRDRLLGGSGADVLEARDGWRDTLDGGAGRDSATLDRVDTARSVERRRR